MIKIRISLELVPRTVEQLIAELRVAKTDFPDINTINIPDLTRFEIRSWDGCGIARQFFSRTIPHIRAIDIDPDRPLPAAMVACLKKHGIREVLIVTGDFPATATPSSTTAIQLIRRFKREMPDIRVYAAVDPYRSAIHEEWRYIREKQDAGADGFFTQPFFDRRLMDLYADHLKNTEVFWGVSPVVTAASRNYWQQRNHVIFPTDFVPDMAWNRSFARRALQFVRERGAHIYFMPIRVDLQRYLRDVLTSSPSEKLSSSLREEVY